MVYHYTQFGNENKKTNNTHTKLYQEYTKSQLSKVKFRTNLTCCS